MKLPLSVAYISNNEEESIGRTIDSISGIASQIVVIDSFSTDKTCEIAKSKGAEVYREEWKGYVLQKNSALEKCKNPWILFLDCDEVPTDELVKEISELIENNRAGAYAINRKTVYLGKLMKYSWQPDRVIRLVHKSLNPKFTGGKVHEKLEFSTGNTLLLKNEILHYSYKNIANHFQKAVNYASLSAETYFDRGKSAGVINLILNPIFAFVNMYFFKMGFLDGWRGIIAAFSSMNGTFLKYSMLMEIQKKKAVR